MKYSAAVIFFFVSVLVILQYSFFSQLASPLSHVNLFLCVMVIMLVSGRRMSAFVWALFSGYLLEYMSLLPSGMALLTFLLLFLSLQYLLSNFFTDQSVLSALMLGMIGSWIFVGLNIFFGFISIRMNADFEFGIFFENSSRLFWYSTLANSIGVVVMYKLMHWFTYYWKSFFLVR